MSISRRLSWVLWGSTILLLAGGLTLAVRNGSLSEDPTFAVLADRLDAIGGSVEIRSNPGEGTTILGRVPVDGI